MSSGKTHEYAFLLVYTAVVIVLLHLNHLTLDPVVVLGALVGTLGAIFPDVDARASKIRIRVQIFLLFLILTFFGLFYLTESFVWAVGLILGVFFLLVIQITHHRGICHSIRFLGLTTISIFLTLFLLGYPAKLISLAWALGFFSHLLLDKTLKF